jgi:gamma-carbonic anhydrase
MSRDASGIHGLILPYRNYVPRISTRAFVAHSATIIGQVTIEADANIWYGCTLRGDDCPITVGARTNIQDGTVVHVTIERFATAIGADVTIGHSCTIHACTLQDRAFVGMGATVLDGAVIESEGMLAAGGVLTPGKRIPSGELWGGNPARLMREVRPADRDTMREIVRLYVERSREFRGLQSVAFIPLP